MMGCGDVVSRSVDACTVVDGKAWTRLMIGRWWWENC
jgi:hypothetical protein